MIPHNPSDIDLLRSEIRVLKKELSKHRDALHEVDKLAAVRMSVLETRLGYMAGKISAFVALVVSLITAAIHRLFF